MLLLWLTHLPAWGCVKIAQRSRPVSPAMTAPVSESVGMSSKVPTGDMEFAPINERGRQLRRPYFFGVGSVQPLGLQRLRSSVANSLSKIEIGDHFPANPLRELCNLGEDLLAFGVFGKNRLRLLIGRLVGVLHNDKPVSGIGPV